MEEKKKDLLENPDQQNEVGETEQKVEPGSSADEANAAEEQEKKGEETLPQQDLLKKLQDENETLSNRIMRQQADFDNYRKRMLVEQERWKEEAVAGFIKELLPVIDNMERALQAAREDNPLTKGVEMVLKQMMQVLEKEGVTQIKSVGERFDPFYHEAVQKEEGSDNPPETVLEEYQKGYIYKGKVIRPSMVKVSG